MDALDQLTRIIPPPKFPVEAGNHRAFANIEATLGLRLPSDYKRLIYTYGTGQWQEFWFVLNPFAANQHLNLVLQNLKRRSSAWSILDAERALRGCKEVDYPHPIFPEPGGILAWAVTDNGGRFFWLTDGPADKWPTVYYGDRSPQFEVYGFSCCELVAGAVTGDIPVFAEAFGDDFAYGRPDAFVPLPS
jgi:hypothetical protein